MTSHHFEHSPLSQEFSPNQAEVLASNKTFLGETTQQHPAYDGNTPPSSNANADAILDSELDRLCREPSSKTFQGRDPEIHSVYSDFDNIDTGFDSFLGFDVSYFDI
jgi:hypothetical protein